MLVERSGQALKEEEEEDKKRRNAFVMEDLLTERMRNGDDRTAL